MSNSLRRYPQNVVNMAAELLRSGLPAPWSHSVTQDGRIFFINDESKNTTWLHPIYNHPIQSGNISQQDLPNGWELAFTSEGVPYFVDHTNLRTSFIHPVTGESALPVHDDNSNISPAVNVNLNKNFKRSSLRRSSKKQKISAPTPKRSGDSPVTLRGWLYKQDSGGLRGWKKRWFVLSDFCLYYYKDSDETQTQGSIFLPSYSIGFCHKDDSVNRKYSFKAEHQNMRTYYFAAENSDEQSRWMKALELATVVKRDPSVEYIESTTERNQSPGPWSDQRLSSFTDPRFDQHDPRNPEDPRSTQDPQYTQDPQNTQDPRSTHKPQYSPDLGDISDDDSRTRPQDTGGFGEPRSRPSALDRLTPRGDDRPLRSSSHDAGLGDLHQHDSEILHQDPRRSPRDSPSPNNSDSMYRQGDDPRTRSDQMPGVRNTYKSREPAYPDPRPNPYPDRWADARHPDQHGSQREDRYRDSITSQGSHSVSHRDYNYNVQKGSLRQPSGYNPQSNGYNPTQYNLTQDSSTLEQSTESLEKTLDRSFDSSQPLPGYDSFRKNQDERPDQYRQQAGNQNDQHGRPVSRESSVVDIQRQNSLLRLQQWTQNQKNKMTGRPSSTYSNASDQPKSDGRRYTGQDSPWNPPSERSSVHSQRQGTSPPVSSQRHQVKGPSMPGINQHHQNPAASMSASTHRSPPANLKLHINSAQNPEGRDNLGRPPIPAAYREQYIRELADTKTPHTRNDLLSSIEIQRLRQHEPLIFKYPEVRPPTAQGLLGQSHFQGPSQPRKQAPTPPPRGRPDVTQPPNKSSSEASSEDQGRPQATDAARSEATGSNIQAPDGLSLQTKPDQPVLTNPSRVLEQEKIQATTQDQDRLRYEREKQHQLQTDQSRKELSAGDIPRKPQRSLDPSKSWDDLNDLGDDPQEAFNVNSRIDQLLAEKKRIMGDSEGQGTSRSDLNYDMGNYDDRGGFSSFKTSSSKVVPHNNTLDESHGKQYVDEFYEKVEFQGQKVAPEKHCDHSTVAESREEFYGYEIPVSQKSRLASMDQVPPTRQMPSPEHNKPVRRSLEPAFQQPLDNVYENTDSLRRATHDLYTKDIQRSDSYTRKMLSESSGGRHGHTVEEDRKNHHGNKSPYNINISDKNDHHGNQNMRYVDQSKRSDVSHLHNNGKQPPQMSQSEQNVQYNTMPPIGQYSPRSGESNQSDHSDRLSQSLGNLHVDVGGWPDNAQAPVKQHVPGMTWKHSEPLLDRISPGQGTLQIEEDISRNGQGLGPQQGLLTGSKNRGIDTIKEDPNMSDQDIFTTKTLADLQRHLSGQRLRLSISANDLIGKSHEELILLLIQLRRDQAKLERMRDYYRSKLDIHRPQEKDYKLKRKNSIGRLHEVVEREHDQYLEIRKMYDELEKQLEVAKPLVNLLDNMVRMGSLYGGDNMMMASQYKQHLLHPDDYTPPKKMITFTRQYQEDKLSKLQEAELKQLMEDEVDLEEKLQQLYKLDRELQEKSISVTNLQENKDLLEKSVIQLRKDLHMTEDPRNLQHIKHQLRHMEGELAIVRQQLAESSRALEETSAEDAMVENEVMLLRKKIYGLNRAHSTPSLTNETFRARQKLEQELEGVQNVMDGLSKQGAMLSDTIKALRHSTPDLTASENKTMTNKTYLETDMDNGRSRDLGKERFLSERDPRYSTSPYERKEEIHYASIKKDRPRDSLLRDRSKSEPPELRPDDPWHHSIDNTDVKMRVESGIEERHAKPEYASIKREPRREIREESLQKSSVTREVRQNVYHQSPRMPDQPDRVDGLYRAEMRMVTPEPSDQHRYQINQPHSMSSQDNSSREELLGDRRGNQDSDRRAYGQTRTSAAHNYPYSTKPMSEVHPQQQVYVQKVKEPVFNQQSSFTVNPDYEPIELSQADDNTKKFFGLLSKDASRSQTVREVKKEAERRSRERKRFYVNIHGDPEDIEEAEAINRDFQRSRSLPRKTSAPMLHSAPPTSHDDSSLPRRKSVGVYKNKQDDKSERRVSAATRLFPHQPGGATTHTNSRDSVRRISDMFSPRPFTTGATWQKQQEAASNTFSVSRQGSGATVATVRPVVNHVNIRAERQAQTISMDSRSFEAANKDYGVRGMSRSSENLGVIQKDDLVKEYWEDRKRNRHMPRSRYMTISSTQPAKMEQTHERWKPSTHHSAAGDLILGHWHDDIPNYIQSEPLKDFKIDSRTIDREVLFVPEKVEIPERYIPDSDDEDTIEDREHRLQKSKQIKRMLAAQSLAEWKQEEVGLRANSGPLHQQVEAERKRREHLLDLKHALAVQVTQRSKQVAGLTKPSRPPYPEFVTDITLTPTHDIYTSHTTMGQLSPTRPTEDTRRIRTLSR